MIIHQLGFPDDFPSYGCKHEAQARQEYEKLMNEKHENVSVSESGLWLNSQWPYMGASPDGVVVCSCHGTGVCEIKVNYIVY